MKNLKLYIITLVIALLAGYVGSQLSSTDSAVETKTETAYERVMRTGVLRCGYAVWPPSLIRDANTGAFSGIFYDYINALGDMLDLKIDWAMETTYADYVTDIQNGKYDAFCGGLWILGATAKHVGYTEPIYFDWLFPYVRSDDDRFDNALEKINDASVRVISQDGEISGIIAAQDYPSATVVSLPKTTSFSEGFENIVAKKADILFTDRTTALSYIKNNPGKIKQVETDQPIRVYGISIGVSVDDAGLQEMLNSATQEMVYAGSIEKILAKYELFPGSYARRAVPYEGFKK